MLLRSAITSGLFAGFMAIALLALPAPVSAVSTVAVSPGGDGVFVVQGIGIEEAAAFEIVVAYDSAALTNPRIVEGPLIAGAMTAVNPNVPGIVRLVAIRLSPVRGTGLLATLTFTRTGPSPGRITSLSAKLATVQGSPLPVLVQVTNPPDSPAITPPTATSGEPTSPGTTPNGPTGSGPPIVIAPTMIITGPASTNAGERHPAGAASGDRTEAPTPPLPEEKPSTGPPQVARRTPETAAADPVPSRKIFAQKSVVERFEAYRGPRTARAYFSLFSGQEFIGFRQEPPMALSDGRAPVTVTFISTPGDRTSSDIAVMGARMVSMRRDPDNTNTWIVELLPDEGRYEAHVTISQGEIMMVYPLTIAPAIDLPRLRIRTEADLDRIFSERLVPGKKGAEFDVNGDGRVDHIDHYILTANYLRTKSRTGK